MVSAYRPKGAASLCLYQTEEKPAHLHLAFTAENRQQVEAFIARPWRRVPKTMVRLSAPAIPRDYYAAFVIGRTGTTSKWFATNRGLTLPSRNRSVAVIHLPPSQSLSWRSRNRSRASPLRRLKQLWSDS
jgi:hypothetical protein